MRKAILVPLVLLMVNVCIGQITFFACPDSFTSSPNVYTFTEEGTDATGRDFYITSPVDGAQSCEAGVCEFKIAWSATNNRWEILLFQNEMDFSDAVVVYYNSNTSSPNPPGLNLGEWIDINGVCGGSLSAANSILSGDVQDTTLGINDMSFLDTQIILYPNPATKAFVVHSNNEVIKRVEIYSTLGTFLFAHESGNKIDVSSLSKGMYIVNIITESDREIRNRILVN